MDFLNILLIFFFLQSEDIDNIFRNHRQVEVLELLLQQLGPLDSISSLNRLRLED
jgi:hypothetical protein